jgi:2-hydroxychromene-2-carboxylate isomerase
MDPTEAGRHAWLRDHRGMTEAAPRFFFGAMSPYSWFAAERIEQLLPDARWSGVLAGAIFKAGNRVSWGLTDRREAGIADCDARAALHGLGPIRWPEPWPTSDLLIARAMTHADAEGQLKPFSLAAMRLAFLEGADLGDRTAVLEAGRRAGIKETKLDRALDSEAIKLALRAVTDEALALGVFGVPSVVLSGELYWGDDELERAAADRRDAPED